MRTQCAHNNMPLIQVLVGSRGEHLCRVGDTPYFDFANCPPSFVKEDTVVASTYNKELEAVHNIGYYLGRGKGGAHKPCLLGVPKAWMNHNWCLGEILAMRATSRLTPPPQRAQKHPFQMPSKLDHSGYPSYTQLRTTSLPRRCHAKWNKP